MKYIKFIVSAVWTYVCLCKVFPLILYKAYDIRLFAIKEFGPIIHEFDPYFNLRATEYLYNNGWKKFVTWFDYQSWYPLGRPVGTTIYPGMQITAVYIKNHIMPHMSINDICCYIPAWFGAIATTFTGLIAYECSLPLFDVTDTKNQAYGSILDTIPILCWIYNSAILPIWFLIIRAITFIFGTDFGLTTSSILPSTYTATTTNQGSCTGRSKKHVDLMSPALEIGLISAGIMAIIPAHMMRSVGGGYDNESVANTAMTMTFFFWCRALRGSKDFRGWSTAFWAVLAAIAYFYMVAVWGGYIFVINLIGLHAAILVILGRFSPKLYVAYSIFYALGTILAIQVPVVGMAPLKSLEQLGPAGVFIGYQLLTYCDYMKRKNNLTARQTWKLRIIVFATVGLVVIAVSFVLDHYFGYFGPISARVRGLFVKHTKTGNPLVDSVAEHQPASAEAYDQYLGKSVVALLPFGAALVTFRYFTDSSSFLLVYSLTTYFFSHKMVRLILLTAPIASVLAGITLGRLLSFFIYNITGMTPSFYDVLLIDESIDENKDETKEMKESSQKKNGLKSKQVIGVKKIEEEKKNGNGYFNMARSFLCKLVSAYTAYLIYSQFIWPPSEKFISQSEMIAQQMSNPTIVMKGRLRSGQEVIVDDYRECYWWIRDNTPPDSRIMAWWDYGYQLTAIANRTTIADGNTWNHEHIALLGRALTSSEKEGHRIARHLADYMLVWSGGGGDDVAKSPHLARIANSVYRFMCPDDPTCSRFGYTKYGPSKMMRESLLFTLVRHQIDDGVMADPNRFKHKFTSKYQKCRVFQIMSVSKESKQWVADPKNRKCDAPGSWFCPGQYPPGMKKILAEKRDFTQLEDFNKEQDDTEYQKKYFEGLNKKKTYHTDNPHEQRRPNPSSHTSGPTSGGQKKAWKPSRKLSEEEIKALNSQWEDNESTSLMWSMINENALKEFMELVGREPAYGHMRSADGRGPMFWAMETGNEKFVRVLKKIGVRDDFKDAKGLTPRDLYLMMVKKNNGQEL